MNPLSGNRLRKYLQKKFFLFNSYAGRQIIYNTLSLINRKKIREGNEVAARMNLNTSLPAVENDVGFVQWPAFALPSTHAVVEDAKKIFEKVGAQGAGKKYLEDIPMEEYLTPDSSFLKFALEPELLATVTNYFGTVPMLREIKMRYSPNKEMIGGSQLFHLDKEDIRTAKVFLFIYDADLHSGPLTGVRADASQRAVKKIKGNWGNIGRLTDEEVLPLLKEGDVGQFYGPSGTIALLDVTRCLHFGSRPNKNPPAGFTPKPRLIVWFMYQSRVADKFPFSLQGNTRFPFSNLITPEMSDVEKYVLS